MNPSTRIYFKKGGENEKIRKWLCVITVFAALTSTSATDKAMQKGNLVYWKRSGNRNNVYHDIKSPDLLQHDMENDIHSALDDTPDLTFIPAVGDFIQEAGKQLNQVGTGFQIIQGGVSDEWQQIGDQITNQANAGIHAIQGGLDDTFQQASNQANNVADVVEDEASNAMNWTQTNVNGRISDFKEIGTQGEKLVSDAAVKIKTTVVDAEEEVKGWTDITWEKIVNYYHTFIRVCEVIGLFIMLWILFKLYRKAKSIGKFFAGIFGGGHTETHNCANCTRSAESRV